MIDIDGPEGEANAAALGLLSEPTCEVRTGPDRQHYYLKGGKSVTMDSGRFNWWGRDPAWKDEIGFRGHQDVENPVGEWNRIEAICDGDTITNSSAARAV